MPELIKNARPLFVLGVPRSGTTMLARLLNSHPQIVQTYETASFLLFDDIIKKAKTGFKAGILYGKEYQEIWSNHLASIAKDTIESFYEKICAQEDRQMVRYWGDKHPHHNACLPFLEKLYPEALYIYIIRDPRDTICSIMEMNKWEFEQTFGVWQKISDRYEMFRDATSEDRMYSARYEDIVSDYSGEIGKMIAWLGLESDEYFQEAVRSKQGCDFHRPNRLLSTDFKTKSVAGWKQKLRPEDKAHVLAHAREHLDKYGYLDA